MHVERLEAKAADMSLELGYLGLEQHVRPRSQPAQAASRMTFLIFSDLRPDM